MAFYEINPALENTTAFIQETELDGTTYRMTFRWSAREQTWYLDITDTSDSPIAMGLRLVEGALLLRYITDPRRPPGELFVEGTPTETNLGTDAFLVYADAAEVSA